MVLASWVSVDRLHHCMPPSSPQTAGASDSAPSSLLSFLSHKNYSTTKSKDFSRWAARTHVRLNSGKLSTISGFIARSYIPGGPELYYLGYTICRCCVPCLATPRVSVHHHKILFDKVFHPLTECTKLFELGRRLSVPR